MSKHAYLIMAHQDDYTFYQLLKMLDCELNDIFIHMDIKNKQFNRETVRKCIFKSNVYFTPSTNVAWGAYSGINAELLLIKTATSTDKYAYYHLLSGQDLPIKAQSYIHNFFDQNSGIEFVRFENEKFNYRNRVRYYYLLQERNGRNPTFFSKALTAVQKVLHINRNKNIEFQKGANWFSITDELARYVVSKEWWIKKTFHDTVCCDELFLQTLIINSKFKDRLTKTTFDDSNDMFMRLIDWKRGKPYVFTIDDLDEIKNSPMLFCRKFSSSTDVDIINTIVELYTE